MKHRAVCTACDWTGDTKLLNAAAKDAGEHRDATGHEAKVERAAVTDSGVSRDDLKECWCCDGLHDSPGTLCPNCSDAGCNRFTDECEADHKPALPDGGRVQDADEIDRGETTLRDVLEEPGSFFIHDSGTIHVRMECQHVDRRLVGGPNGTEPWRKVQSENLIGLLDNRYPTEIGLCGDCRRWWDNAE